MEYNWKRLHFNDCPNCFSPLLVMSSIPEKEDDFDWFRNGQDAKGYVNEGERVRCDEECGYEGYIKIEGGRGKVIEGYKMADAPAIEQDTLRQFLRKVTEGGCIVSSNECHHIEIAVAASCQRVLVDEDGLGFIYRPGKPNVAAVSPSLISGWQESFHAFLEDHKKEGLTVTPIRAMVWLEKHVIRPLEETVESLCPKVLPNDEASFIPIKGDGFENSLDSLAIKQDSGK